MSSVSLDEVDHEILDLLVKNARAPSKNITHSVNEKNIKISDRAVRKRINRLEKSGAILGYRAQLDYDKVELPFPRLIMIKFKTAKDFRERAGDFISSLKNNKFISSVAYVLGEYDVICMGHYSSREQATSENVAFQEKFHDIILQYNSYDCQVIKELATSHELK